MERIFEQLRTIDDEAKEIVNNAKSQALALITAAKDELASTIENSKEIAIQSEKDLQEKYLQKLQAVHKDKTKGLDDQLTELQNTVKENWDEAIVKALELIETQL